MKNKFSIFNFQFSIWAKYLRVWWVMTMAVFSIDLANRFAAFLFLIGKLLRFLFFLGFLILLVSRTKTLAGYDLPQVVFFFLTFNLVDIATQLFLRGVYYFRPLIVRGDFDFYLLKPLNSLFQSLASHADVLDLITFVPLILYMIFFLISGQIVVAPVDILLYAALILNAFLIATALHIIVLAIGVLTTEVDHLIWIYRDLSGMGKIPIDVYREWLRNFLIFVVPVGVMMTFPAKALMSLLSLHLIIFSFLFGGIFLWASVKFWQFAIRHYSSASS